MLVIETYQRRTIVVFVASILYWGAVCHLAEVREPWDAAAYWMVAYPLSLAIAASAGWHVGRYAFVVGMMTALAQLPVMAMMKGGSIDVVIALTFLIPLSIPHGAVALAAARVGRSRPR